MNERIGFQLERIAATAKNSEREHRGKCPARCGTGFSLSWPEVSTSCVGRGYPYPLAGLSRRPSRPPFTACPPRFAILASLAPIARSRTRATPPEYTLSKAGNVIWRDCRGCDHTERAFPASPPPRFITKAFRRGCPHPESRRRQHAQLGRQSCSAQNVRIRIDTD